MPVAVYNVPEGPPLVVRVKVKGTKHIQHKKTGQMRGRKSVKSGGETITRRRVKKSFVLVRRGKSKKRGHVRQKKAYEPGQWV